MVVGVMGGVFGYGKMVQFQSELDPTVWLVGLVSSGLLGREKSVDPSLRSG